MRWANAVLPSGYGWIIMGKDERWMMRCPYERPFTKLYTFSAPKKANFSPLASNVAITPPPSLPFPSPSLPFPSHTSIFANPNAAIVARSIPYSSASPSIHDAFGNRSLSNHSPHSTSHSRDFDANSCELWLPRPSPMFSTWIICRPLFAEKAFWFE